MTVQSPTSARLADLALIAYLAPLVQGRRVAVVGPTSGEVARRARALGASTVVSFGGAGEDLAVRALTPGALAGFHGKLDLVVVPSAGAVPSLVAVLDEARRALGSEGVVVVASEPEDGAPTLEPGAHRAGGFETLRELCQQRFARVQLLGRGPFVGYTVASLSEGAEQVGLETRLLDGDPPAPEALIAVASDSPIALEPLTVVQVPSGVLDAVRADAARALEEALAQRDQKLKETENASAEKWVRLQRLEHQYKELEEEARKARERAVRASKDLEDERKLRQRIELEGQMSRRAPELPKTPEPDPEVPRLRARVSELEAEVLALRGEAAALTGEASALRGEVAAQKAAAATLRDEGAALRASHGLALEAALARTRDLEHELDETHAAEAELRAQLDEAIERPTIPPAAPTRDTREEERLRVRAQAAEAELQALRAEGLSASEERSREHAALELALARSAGEALRLGAEKARLEEAVRELCLAADSAAGDDPRGRLAAAEEQRLQARRVYGALADCADTLAHENDLLRERLAAAEAHATALSTEAAAAQARGRSLEADLARARESAAPEAAEAPEVSPEEVQGLRHELEALLLKDAVGSGQAAGFRMRVAELEDRALELERALADARAARDFDRHAVLEAQNEVARTYAQTASAEARLAHLLVELEGAQAGARRRIAELEAEAERLVAALEVAGTQAAFEAGATQDSQTRELDGLRAEREGLAFRVREAERALTAARSLRSERAGAVARCDAAEARASAAEAVRAALAAERDALQDRLDIAEAERGAAMGRLGSAAKERDGVLAELQASRAARDALQGAVLARARAEALASEVEARLGRVAAERAERLAEAERELQAERAERDGMRFRLREAEGALVERRADADRRVGDALERASTLEAERDEALASSEAQPSEEGAEARMEQLLEDLSATAARLAETEERLSAARAEHDAAVAAQGLLRGQLDDRDLRLAAMERRLSQELASMQLTLSQESQANGRLRASLEGVRTGLSSILIDGRGAVVAHDLVMLLRQIEAAS
ncbi:MAG: hypothetical protein HY909_11810 [Deltaproteobacteria bacterium]|nr:hypothetical protein [Deltaproteobacteria bacterium]